ncbi:filamentous hemagglutinin N-terminal domain-containing protein [Trinickia sp. NRRL B-1857]|uniref:two-partner secretion domain-containing protein n=1 Tax=Trinickia sp. NRRL B-1857 TaxID=3162879 RepID=UPI003D2AA419
MKPSNSASYKARSVSAISFAVAVLFTSVHAHAGPLPSGGQFVAGTGSFDRTGRQLTINQTSNRGIIDWTSFSIGHGNRVDIDNGSGTTLNRVTGSFLSWIGGTLSSTGSVYLINPHGVVVGPTGVISTGGRFVATTLDADNAAFMAGGALTLTGNSTAQIVNLGTIGSSGGDVFLIARKMVSNFGSISAPTGSVELAAGQTVLLQDSISSRQVFVQTGSHGSVRNSGTLQAAQISLQAADGNIYAFGGNHSVVRATGTAARDGHVWLVADTGYVKQAGRVDATNADGTGGIVDTIAATFSPCLYGPTTVVAGIWNITAPSLAVNWPVSVALSNSLSAGTSVNVTTTQGDIGVGSNILWNGNASLTFGAYGSIALAKGATIQNRGAGDLTLRADAAGIDNHGSVTNNGTVDWSHSTGIVSALYDMNGTYTPGTLRANAVWTPATGSGLTTQITGYELANSLADLQNISQNLTGNYALGKNLDGAGASVISIGSFTSPFSGQFDGMGHTINGITIVPVNLDDGTLLSAGLFGAIGSSGVVRNLNLTNSYSSVVSVVEGGPSITLAPAGLLVGINQGLVANVFASGSLDVFVVMAGGLVGQNQGLIERSAADVAVQGTMSVAELVGENDGTISQSYATGPASGLHPGGYAEGLVYRNKGAISQSFITGAVFQNPFDGGSPVAIAGNNTGGASADNYWNVQTTGVTNGGGGVPASHGLTTAQMSDPASFVGWDFSANGAWVMPAGWTHPVLRWQMAAGLPPQ